MTLRGCFKESPRPGRPRKTLNRFLFTRKRTHPDRELITFRVAKRRLAIEGY